MVNPLKIYTLPDRKSQGWFGSKRKFDIHTGIDLYCKDGDDVYSIEDGIVVNICHFTGPKVGLDWWNDTDAILIKGKSGIILYGEIDPSVIVGQPIKEGDKIGNILRVLKEDKGKPMDMLHLELYESDYLGDGEIWSLNEDKPNKLKDPSCLLQLRFNFDANTREEAYNYITNRNIQLLKYGVSFESTSDITMGLDATYQYKGEEYHAIYIYKNFRGMGLYPKYVKENGYKILTHNDCEISDYLSRHGITFVCLGDFEKTNEYRWIEKVYGSKRTKRTGAYLMNHIDEGLRILEDIGASDIAKRAYCLHPIFQGDDELLSIYKSNYDISPDVLVAVMEYRSVANDYLSTRTISSIGDIRLSPLKDVNDMLIADKVQNYKDFEIYHKKNNFNTGHPRSKELDEYFKNWLSKLNIEKKYQTWSHLLHTSTKEI